MVDLRVSCWLARVQRLLRCIEDEAVGIELLTRQPTMRRVKTSITKAT